MTDDEREGLKEQIRLDRAQIDRQLDSPKPDIAVIQRLQEHIEWCERQLG